MRQPLVALTRQLALLRRLCRTPFWSLMLLWALVNVALAALVLLPPSLLPGHPALLFSLPPIPPRLSWFPHLR